MKRGTSTPTKRKRIRVETSEESDVNIKSREYLDEIVLRAQCAALYQHADMSQAAIAFKLAKHRNWVSKWCEKSCFLDAPRSGRPRTSLTPANLKKLSSYEKKNAPVRTVGPKLKMSKSSASRGFLQLGLKAYRRPKVSKLTKKHIAQRYVATEKFKDEDPEFWDNWIFTDEKWWSEDGFFNPQNDRVRAKRKEDVDPHEVGKFPAKRMVWMGISSRTTTGCVWFKKNVNGEVYRKEVLQKVMVDDVMQREDEDVEIHRRKMFTDNDDFIFEQDWATPHSTNINHEFMEEHFPAYTPTLWRHSDKPLFLSPKFDDIIPIERFWAIKAQEVYRNPRPKGIKNVMRRLRESVRKTKPSTLTKLVHSIPAKFHEVYRLKGKKLSSSFKARDSPYACKCNVCSEPDDML